MRVSKEVLNTRKIQILQELTTRAMATSEELMEKFKYPSIKLVWQDIDRLHQEGLVLKVRGGVRSKIVGVKDCAVNRRFQDNADKKKAIANFVIEKYFIEENQGEPTVIFLDAGSTTQILFREISLHPMVNDINLNVITNNVAASDYTCPPNIRLHLTGGRYLYEERCLVGKAAEFFRSFRAKMAFLAASTLSLSNGLLAYNSSECAVKSAMIENADNIFILVDESKFKNSGGELLGKFAWEADGGGMGLKLVLAKESKSVRIILNNCSSETKENIFTAFRSTQTAIAEADLERSIIFAPYAEGKDQMS